jgi:cytochrome b
MSFRAHMQAIVGDQNTVARYLFEKIGHVAFFTLLLWGAISQLRRLVDLPPSPLWLCALCIAIAYDVVGKALWLYQSWKRAKIIVVGGLLNGRTIGDVLGTHFVRDDLISRVILSDEIHDTIFDLWVTLIVVVVAASPLIAPVYLALAFLLWLCLLAAGSNNRWGSPS